MGRRVLIFVFFSWRDSVKQCGFLIYVYVCINIYMGLSDSLVD